MNILYSCKPAIFAAIFALALIPSDSLRAEPPGESKYPAGHSPAVCIGFNQYLSNGAWGIPNFECPPGSAVLGVAAVGPSRYAEGRLIPVEVSCCRLPAADILLDEQIEVVDSCPEDFVATGGQPRDGCKDCEKKMRCSKLNTRRYQLGEKSEGVFWGFGSVYRKQRHRIMKAELPVALRYGLGRQSELHWMPHGCVGHPAGSILVGKASKRCHDFRFQQLQFRGLPGDPLKGTAVQMFPDCRSLSDIFDPQASCRKPDETSERSVPDSN